MLNPLSTVNMFPSRFDQHVSSDVIIDSLLSNPEFDLEPDIHTVGSSGEFSGMHLPETDETESYIELSWSHTAGTALNFLGEDPEDIMPDYDDFIYTYQEFDWPYDQLPDDVQVLLNSSVIRTGDFAEGAQLGSNLMFRVFVWIIDSSGNWAKVYESREAVYTEEFTEKRIELNYFGISDAFMGMVEVNGTQEDPEDKATLAIGLAPTRFFDYYDLEHPWEFYTGTVQLRVDYVDIFYIMDTPSDPSSRWQPEHNSTYGTTIGEVFPDVEQAEDEVWNECQGIVVGSDNSIYVTGDTRSSYEFYIETGLRFRNQFLLKYNPSLDLLWAVENDNETLVRAITFKSGNVYTTGLKVTEDGDRDLIVTKWSAAGQRVWQTEWGGDFDQAGVGVAVANDGSIFVMASDFSLAWPPFYESSTLLKFDSNGDFLWNKTTELVTFFDARGDLYITQENLFFMSYGLVLCTDHEGSQKWLKNTGAMTPDGHGGLFAVSRTYLPPDYMRSGIVLSQWDETGVTLWNCSYSVTWPNGWAYSYNPVDIAVTPSNTILVLVYNTWVAYDFTLLSFDTEGNLLRNRTIGDEYWPWMAGGPVFINVGANGLAYFAYTCFRNSLDIGVQAYSIGESTGGPILTIPMVVMVASSVVIVGAAGAIFLHKRRIS
jgi:hypothetical protein